MHKHSQGAQGETDRRNPDQRERQFDGFQPFCVSQSSDGRLSDVNVGDSCSLVLFLLLQTVRKGVFLRFLRPSRKVVCRPLLPTSSLGGLLRQSYSGWSTSTIVAMLFGMQQRILSDLYVIVQ